MAAVKGEENNLRKTGQIKRLPARKAPLNKAMLYGQRGEARGATTVSNAKNAHPTTRGKVDRPMSSLAAAV